MFYEVHYDMSFIVKSKVLHIWVESSRYDYTPSHY